MKKTKLGILIAVIVIVLGAGVYLIPFPQKIHKTMSGVYIQETSGIIRKGEVTLEGWVLHYLFRPNAFKGSLFVELENGHIYDSGSIRGEIKEEGVYSKEFALQGGYTRIIAANRNGGYVEKPKWISKAFNQVLIQYIVKDDFSEIILVPTEGEYFVAPANGIEEAEIIIERLYSANPNYPVDVIK